jgi:N utilization substance protein B
MNRHKARELALKVLFSIDFSKEKENISSFFETYAKNVPDEIKDFAYLLINTTLKDLKKIDELIREYAKNWKFQRIARVDKNILRIGIAELLNFRDTPKGVIIDEAVKLAKRFSDESSYKFVNAILDRLAKDLGL